MGAAVAWRAIRGCGGAQRGRSFAAGVCAVTEGEGEPPAIVAGRMCDEVSEGWKVRHPCDADPLPSMPEPRPGDRKRPNRAHTLLGQSTNNMLRSYSYTSRRGTSSLVTRPCPGVASS